MEYINTVLTHAQMLPYFRQHVVSTELLAEVEQINKSRTKQPHWKWQHLPSSKDPNTGIQVFHYQGCRYEYTEGETEVLSHEDVHQLIALTLIPYTVSHIKPNAHRCDTIHMWPVHLTPRVQFEYHAKHADLIHIPFFTITRAQIPIKVDCETHRRIPAMLWI